MKYNIAEKCVGFEWDSGNRYKNHNKHNVLPLECEEIFFNIPLIILDDQQYSQNEQRYYALGKTNSERKLFVVFTTRNQHIRIISARPMSQKERKNYETHTQI